MNRYLPLIIMTLVLMIPACNKERKDGNNFPDDFNKMSDQGKVAYMMQHVSADSVARFIIYASLGKIDGVSIDTLNNATLAAYENYTDTALQTFSWEFDRLSEELPLPDKMKLRMLVGAEDPQGLGLTLGLEYMNQIRVRGMKPEEVFEELRELKRACKDDMDVYARFIIGFRTVLRYDKNSDMPKDIYNTFLNYDEEEVQAYYSRNKSKPSSEASDSISAEDMGLTNEIATDSISETEISHHEDGE